MNVFYIPSWYPTADFPTVGIFLKEQAQLIAKAKPEWNIGISLWGSHEPSLWLKANSPLQSLILASSRSPIKPYDNQLAKNCVEIFHPAFIWTRRIRKGNMKGIVSANRKNFERYERLFGEVDVIHAHVAYPAGIIAKQLSQEFQIPYVITEHMSPFPLPSFKSDFRQIVLPPLKDAATAIAVSGSLQKELHAYGIESHVIPNVIDTETFRPGQVKNEMTQILAVGRLEHQKGFDLLIEALAELKGRDWHISIIGEGSERNKLVSLIQKNGLESRVELQGDLTREAIANKMQCCDFFVLSSRHESFGMVAAEAMACGKPVVFTKCGGFTDEMADSVGIFSEIEVDALKRNIDHMLNHFVDYESHVIRDFIAKRFAPDVVSNQLEEVYQDVLNSFQKV